MVLDFWVLLFDFALLCEKANDFTEINSGMYFYSIAWDIISNRTKHVLKSKNRFKLTSSIFILIDKNKTFSFDT